MSLLSWKEQYARFASQRDGYLRAQYAADRDLFSTGPPLISTCVTPMVKPQENKMRSLFTVFVVEQESGEVMLEKSVVATDETQALQKALLSSGVNLGKDLDEYVTIVDLRGSRNVIEPRTKLQKVQIVKDE